jgi:hypothetical protein
VGYYSYLIRYHFGVEPNGMTKNEFAQAIAHLKYIRQEEAAKNLAL